MPQLQQQNISMPSTMMMNNQSMPMMMNLYDDVNVNKDFSKVLTTYIGD